MILDRSPANDTHYLAVGGSGHSFKIAPAMGLCLAEMIVDGSAKTVDISPLRAGPIRRRRGPSLHLRRQQGPEPVGRATGIPRHGWAGSCGTTRPYCT